MGPGAKFKHTFSDAKIEIDSYEIGSANPLPFSILKLSMNFRNEPGQSDKNGHNDGIYWSIEAYPLSVTIKFSGMPICEAYDLGLNTLNSKIIFLMPISLGALKFIESTRNGDLQLSIGCVFNYNLVENGKTAGNNEGEYRGRLHFNAEMSESKWLKILKDLKYSDKMLIEIESPNTNLPRTMGFEEILKKIDGANAKLLERTSPEDIITDLRSAWDLFDKYHKDYKDEMDKLIRNKSKKEDNEPAKEERIDDIKEAVSEYFVSIYNLKKTIDKLTQIGPHREIYHSTMEDAELAFRITVSLIAYYSSFLTRINKEGE